MYRTGNSNLIEIACLIASLVALQAPTPVQSLPSYRLTSATVDAENPTDAADVFTATAYETIQLEYVDTRVSQILGTTKNGAKKTALFWSLDYHTMILGYVVFDTGNPNSAADCHFANEADAEEFYEFLRPTHNPCHPVKYPVASVLLYNYMRDYCEDGQCNDPTYSVSKKGHIFVEPISEPDANDHTMKRFIIIDDEDGKVNMVFTSWSFYVTWDRKRNNVNAMLSISVRNRLFKILIEFKNTSAARGFHKYVNAEGDTNPEVPHNIPEIWLRDMGRLPDPKE